jgi:hypothetical protein
LRLSGVRKCSRGYVVCAILSLDLLGCTYADPEASSEVPRATNCSDYPPSPWNAGGVEAHNAAEAWPSRPGPLPKLDDGQIIQACIVYASCVHSEIAEPTDQLLSRIGDCMGNVAISAERAIPISGSPRVAYNERAEFFVSCVGSANRDCIVIQQCLSSRPEGLKCREDGCWDQSSTPYIATCNGTVATLTKGSKHFERDCARAYAECDPKSRTGCTDRPPSRCPLPLDACPVRNR